MKVLMLGFNLQEEVFPLGLECLRGYAKKQHSNVDFIIKQFRFGNRTDDDTNKNIELQISSYVLLQNPEVVCFSAYIWNVSLIETISCLIKKNNSQIKIVVGGPEITKNNLSHNIDYLILNEGEIAFKELIDYFLKKREIEKVSNLVYRKNNKIFQNGCKILDNLDDIPFPYKNRDIKQYHALRIETSRGCAFSCKYCNYAERKLRYFSEKYLKKNIDYLFKNHEFKRLTIFDANVNIDKKHFSKVLKIIEKNVQKYNKKIVLGVELKPELIDEELINMMENVSFKIFAELGLQSTNKEVLDYSSRKYDEKMIKQGLKLLNNSSIDYKIDLMYGLPKDDFFKFLNSLNFLLKNAIKQNNIPAHHFMLLNNTSFFNDKKIERLRENNSSLVVKTETQGTIDLYKTKLFIDLVNEELKIS